MGGYLPDFAEVLPDGVLSRALYYIGLEVDSLGGASADELMLYGIWVRGYLAVTGEN